MDEQYNRISLLHGSTSQQFASQQEENVTNSNGNITQTYRMYCWGGRLRLIPENYKIPNVGMSIIWSQWWFASGENIPPLKVVTGKDLSREQGRRLSDLIRLIKTITDGLRSADQYFENPNQLQVMQMYENGIQYLNIRNVSDRGRIRRTGELLWTTLARTRQSVTSNQLRSVAID